MRIGFVAAVVLSCFHVFGAPEKVIVSAGGKISVGQRCSFSPAVYGAGWTNPPMRTEPNGSTLLDLGAQGTVRVTCQYEQKADGEVLVRYDFDSNAEGPIEQLFVNMDMPGGRLDAGGKWSLNEQEGTFPLVYQNHHLAGNAATQELGIRWTNRALKLAFEEAREVSILDCRGWGSSFVCRILAPVAEKNLARGTTYQVAFTLAAPNGLLAVADGPVTIQEGDEWVPLPSSKNVVSGSALDFSSLYPWHAPAGARGRVLANGPHFVFEDAPETPVRFYGANLCFSANFLSEEQAEELARRYRSIGYNTVRIHHYDGFITEGTPDNTSLNPEHMALLDNTLAAFIRHGVYITTDLFVSRSIPWRQIGVDRDGMCPCDEFKARCAISEAALNNWKAFARAFLTHRNSHTGRTYAEEPALAFLCLVNEGNLGNSIDHQRNIPEYSERWKAWLTARRAESPETYNDIPETLPDQLWNPSPHGIAYLQFVDELEGAMVLRMKEFLRNELHCKAMLSDSNGWISRTTSVRFRAQTLDYADDHFYFDHPRFLERSWCLPSFAASNDPLYDGTHGVPTCTYARIFGRPFTVSEYNYAVPSQHRAIGGMIFGTLAALQEWSVLWRFAYSHSREALFEDRHHEFFDIALDDGMLAADRIALCLFLRGDRAPLPRALALTVPEHANASEVQGSAWALSPSWASAAWHTQVGYSVENDATTRPHLDASQSLSAGSTDASAWPSPGTMPLGTPDSRCMIFPAEDDVSAVVSLDGAPIASSRHLLVTHIPEIIDQDTTFADQARTILTAFGTLPHLVHASQRTLSLPLQNASNLRVYPLNPDGSRRDPIPTTAPPSELSFVLDSTRATLYYEITEL